jgi:hypothetical protein
MNKTYNMKKTIITLLMFVGITANAQLCWNTSTATANVPRSSVFGDFNNDGNSDFAVTTGSLVSVYLGTPSGTFQNSPNYSIAISTVGFQGGKIVAGQFNSNVDNNLDLVVGNLTSPNGGYIVPLFGVGNGSFSVGTNYTVSTLGLIRDLCVVDLNSDNKSDILATGDNTGLYFISGSGNNTTTFSTATLIANGPGFQCSISTGSLNTDAYIDVVLSSPANVNISVLLGTSTFTTFSSTTYSTGSTRSDSYLADLDNDNDLDLVLTSVLAPGNIRVFKNNAAGNFTATPSQTIASSLFRNFVCKDFNKDGNIDLAGVTSGAMEIMLGTGTGSLNPPIVTTFTNASNLQDISADDFDYNSNQDIVFTSYATNLVFIMSNGFNVSSSPSWSVCVGNSATLTALGATSYSFNGVSSGSVNVVTPTNNPTTYTILGSAANGCTTSVTKTITLNPAPSLTLTGTNPICIGSTSTFSVSGATTYTWSNGSTLTAVALSPTVNTTYSVVGTSSLGCSSTSSIVLAVNQLPVISISGPNVVCIGNSATLTASGASTYTWTSPSSTLSQIAVSPTVNTLYSVIGTNTNGCVGSGIKNIVVSPLPTVSISGPSVICFGGTLTLSANGALNYNWSNGVNASNITVSPSTNTVYSVVGVDVNGCSDTTSSNVTVNPLPNLVISGVGVICEGDTVTLSVTGASTYTWNTNSQLPSIIVNPNTTTPYSVQGTDINGCKNISSHVVTVNPLPNVSVSGPSVICYGETTTLSTSGASSYTWSNGSNFVNMVITPTSNVTYTVIGVDQNQCYNNAAITVSVSECVGFKNVLQNEISISLYPNPNNGTFTIKSENDAVVKIINEVGQVVKVEKLNANNNKEVSVVDLSEGLYFVVCESNGQKTTKKVIVSK